MAVEVYWWPPKGGDKSVGHAAIMVDGGKPAGRAYLSVWPGELLSIVIGSASFFEYQDDVRTEGGRPRVVRLTRLNETAIRTQVKNLQQTARYSFVAMNCATQASICLNAGLPAGIRLLQTALDFMGPNRISMTVMNTPWNLFAYAKSLSPHYG
jgi:hypothetical protein